VPGVVRLRRQGDRTRGDRGGTEKASVCHGRPPHILRAVVRGPLDVRKEWH
jgi:hypothetical protein